MRATVERDVTRRGTPFREGRTDVIVLVNDEGISRVRLARVRTSLGLYTGEPHTQEDSYFLDGWVTRRTVRLGVTHRERIDMGLDVVPVRTGDVTDFGRLQTAASTLTAIVQQFGPGNPPSPEQLESMLNSYRGILEWRRKARSRMAAAEGQIDLTEASLRNVLSV